VANSGGQTKIQREQYLCAIASLALQTYLRKIKNRLNNRFYQKAFAAAKQLKTNSYSANHSQTKQEFVLISKQIFSKIQQNLPCRHLRFSRNILIRYYITTVYARKQRICIENRKIKKSSTIM
jgi:hypothetical protein